MDGKKRTAADDRYVGLRIKSVADKIRVRANAQFAQYGLTSAQAAYIGYLDCTGGSASQKKIERYFNVSHPTVAGIISRLEKKDFVRVRPDENDRRNNIVELTEKARVAGREFEKSRQEMERQLTGGLSKDEVRELARLLTIMENNLKTENSNHNSLR